MKDEITLDREAVIAIRHALIVGLSSYGEISRLCGNARLLKKLGTPLPDSCAPIHPTGTDETIGHFADALHYLSGI